MIQADIMKTIKGRGRMTCKDVHALLPEYHCTNVAKGLRDLAYRGRLLVVDQLPVTGMRGISKLNVYVALGR